VGGLVNVLALRGQVARHVGVLVPAAVEDLYEPHVALGKPACQQGTAGEAAGSVDVGAIHIKNVFRLVRDIDQLGDRGLHAKGHLVLGDACLGLGVSDRLVLPVVQPVDGVKRAATGGGVNARRIGQEEYRITL